MVRWLVLAMIVGGAAAPGSSDAATILVTSARFGNVLYDTTPPAFDVAVVSGFAHVVGVLVTDVTDPYGVSVLHDEFPIDITWSTATRHLTIPSSLKGRFAVTARLYDPVRNEPPLVAKVSGVAVVPLPPVPGFDDQSAVGYFVAPEESGPLDETTNADAIAGEMQDLGVKWVRYGYVWRTDTRRDRPDTGDPSWLDTARYETWVDAYRAHGMQVMANLSSTARWASTRPDDEREITYFGQPVGLGPIWGASAPVDTDWVLFLQTMQTRLAGRVQHWEIWNEPESYLFFEPVLVSFRPQAAQLFAQVAASAVATLRGGDPSARIIVSPSQPNLNFETAVIPVIGAALDVFGYHYGNPAAVAYAKSVFVREGLTPPAFWNTEAFGGTDEALPFWIRQRAAGATRIFPFIWSLYGGSGPTYFGVRPIGDDYVPDPLALGVRTLSDQIGRATPVGNFAIRPDASIQGYVFADGARDVVAVLREDPAVPLWAPADPGLQLVARVPAGTQSLRVTDGMGNARTLVPIAGQVRIPLDGNPVYVEGLDTGLPQPLEFVTLLTAACGNGRTDPGEECDDGNTIDGDSCSNTCRYACPPQPLPDCIIPPIGQLSLRRNTARPDKNKLTFKWTGEMFNADLGNPLDATSYALCVYDRGTDGAARVMTIGAAPGGLCAGVPCWSGSPPNAFTYNDRTSGSAGLQKLQLKKLPGSWSKIRVMAKGAALDLAPLPMSPPVTVQLQAGTGACWNAVFQSRVTRNDDGAFVAKIDPYL